jgi:pimeloyl-ACP methyl ester carboxylesterase
MNPLNLMKTVHLTRPRIIMAAAILALAGILIPASQAALARSAPARAAPSSAAKPAIVLEHGAWADASSWDAVIARLQSDGYTVYAPPDPLQSLPYDSATLSDFLSTINGPIVLVGHSYGGMVITNAARGHPTSGPWS